MSDIPFSAFGSPYQYREVEAGKSAVVYLYDVPPDWVGFIYDLALSWYRKTYLGWEIDNEMVETIEHRIGDFRRPKVFNPPYLVENQVKFTAYNNDNEAHIFRVRCDGILRQRVA